MGSSKTSGTKTVSHANNFSTPSNERLPFSNDRSSSQRAPTFRFLDLPQELRDKVYEGLLCPHIDGTQYRRHEKIRDCGLEPAILSTCKQVCQEASRVLYAKNGTVLVRMSEQAFQDFQTATSKGCSSFPEVYPFARVECGDVGGVPVLTMEISVLPQFIRQERKQGKGKGKDKSLPEKQVVFIGFLPALPKICRFITSCRSAETLQLVVHMERPIGRSPETQSQMLSDCLGCFREAQGLGRAAILTEPQHSAAATEVADLMMTGIKTFEDALSLVCAYEARVSRLLKEKRWNDARDTVQNALELFEFLWYGPCASSTIGVKQKHEFEAKLINTQWNHVFRCLKVGRTGDARHQIRQMFQYCSPQERTRAQKEGYWGRVADAHYAIGKAYMIDGALNSAVYSFLEALLAAPGHVEAGRAIDDLEERVKFGSKQEDVMVRLNIECVLKEIRYQVPGQHRLTEDQKKDIVGSFAATYNEIQRLLGQPDVTTIGITIMEPYDIPPFSADCI